MSQYVIVIPDGAADTNRERGGSPLEVAHTPAMDFVARAGIGGVVTTLHADLPYESMVAQLGILGWDPRLYYPCGRASSELLAHYDLRLNRRDVAFRANLVRMEGNTLASYSAGSITSDVALPLVERVQSRLREAFPEVELYHLSDFRNTLIFRDASIDPRVLVCPEPHESHQCRFDLERLVSAKDPTGVSVARRLNEFVNAAAEILSGEPANALFPWSPSRAFDLPSFESLTGIGGRVAAVGFMDFLIGIAKAGGIEFHRVGNGRPDTDYRAKGQTVVELLDAGCTCVVCHINGPDEASHAGDLDGKIASLERIDRDIVMPILQYFERHPADLGGVIVLPDHYSNIQPRRSGGKRSDVHTPDPVPFALWNNRECDRCSAFNESAVRCGKYGAAELTHLDILPLLLGRGAEVVGA